MTRPAYRVEVFVTGREAASILGLGRETTHRLLRAGFAGAPVHAGGAGRAMLYRRSAVEELRDLPPVEPDALPEHGIVVGRLNPRSGRHIAGPWGMGFGLYLGLLTLRNQYGGTAPFVATLGGLVFAGGEIEGVDDPADRVPGDRRDRRVMLRLGEPGPWYGESCAFRWLRTPAGHPLLFWQCPLVPKMRHQRDPWP